MEQLKVVGKSPPRIDALELIEVKYEELLALFDAEEAFKPNPPVIIHPDPGDWPTS